MPDTRSENESMLIEDELDAKGAGVGDVPTWCGTPPMSAAGRFYSFFQAAIVGLSLLERPCLLWRGHDLFTLSFLCRA